MRRLIILLSLLLPPLIWAEERNLPIIQFGGVETDTHPLLLKDGKSPASFNVRTDEAGGILPREGYIAYSTVPAKAFWIFPKSDGTRYVITHSGDFLKADTGAKTFATLVSTVAADVTTVGAVLGDRFYFSNLTDGLKYWDGSSVSVASDAMKVSMLVTWKGRLAAAGKVVSPRTIFLSKYLDGTLWNLVTNPSDDDPAQIVIGGALDENLSALYASFQDLLIWFKAHSFGGIFGSRRSNFINRTYADFVGTTQSDTVVDCAGLLRWLSPERDVWEFNGSGYQKIMEDNDTLFDQIINGESNTRTFTYTSQTDFQLGTASGTSLTLSPGDVVLSTWTDLDTSSTNFAGGTLTNLSTTTTDGSIVLSVNNTNVTNNGFEDGSGTDADNWTELNGNTQRTTSLVQAGSQAMAIVSAVNQIYSIQILDSSESVLTSAAFEPTDGVWTQRTTINLSAYIGRNIKIRFQNDNGSGYVTSDLFLCSGETLTWYDRGAVGSTNLVIDTVEGGRSSVTTGSLLSRTFDTAFTTAAWLASNASYTKNGHEITFETQTSSNSVNWNSLVSWSTGSAPASLFGRYIRYQVTLATRTAGTALPSVEDVTFAAKNTSGTFVSGSISIGDQISGWSVFDAQSTSSGGQINYAFYTDTDSTKVLGANGLPVASSFVSSQTIAAGSVPTVSTATYAFVSEVFSITAATQAPTNHSLSLSWNEGSAIKAKGLYTEQRYWLAVGVSSTANNRVHVYDRRKEWQEYRNLGISAMIQNNATMLFGNSGGIYEGQTGPSDNGAEISWSYQTKAFAPASLDYRSYMRHLWVTTAFSDLTLNTSYYPDGGSAVSLAPYTLNAQPGYQNFKLPFSASDLQHMKHISIGWSGSSADDWQILGASLYFDVDQERD